MSLGDVDPTSEWRGIGLTDSGKVRSANQDAFAVHDALHLWAVADGMSGYAGGEIASRLAVAAVTTFFQRCRAEDFSSGDRKDLLRQSIEAAHHAIRAEARDRPELRRMGTTLVVLSLIPGPPAVATLAHVGDSRAYLLRGRALTQLTQDHSLMRDYVRRGLVSEQEALTHPQRHVLMRALGVEGQAEPDFSSHELQDGDRILLCTDGLTTMLADWEILDTLLRVGSPAGAACRELVEAANRRGGQDNITVILVRKAGPVAAQAVKGIGR
jgi:protein phosphatase